MITLDDIYSTVSIIIDAFKTGRYSRASPPKERASPPKEMKVLRIFIAPPDFQELTMGLPQFSHRGEIKKPIGELRQFTCSVQGQTFNIEPRSTPFAHGEFELVIRITGEQ